MNDKVAELIKLIVFYASEYEVTLTRLRLVKFIYLADLYFARVKGKETLTSLPWAFIYFGPYCTEVSREIDAAVAAGIVKEEARQSTYQEKDYFLYHSVDDIEPSIKQELPVYVLSELKHAIKRWGEDSGGLLDYVYFETEPMMDVRKGQLLDFSKALMPQIEKKLIMKRLSSNSIAKAKDAIKKLKDKTTIASRNAFFRERRAKYDDIYFSFLSSITESDLEAYLEGEAEIKDK